MDSGENKRQQMWTTGDLTAWTEEWNLFKPFHLTSSQDFEFRL